MERPMYFRRCHMCGSVCETEGHEHMASCPHCGKAWARFRYFDDRLSPIQSDRNLRSQSPDGEWIPINGLTVYWESF